MSSTSTEVPRQRQAFALDELDNSDDCDHLFVDETQQKTCYDSYELEDFVKNELYSKCMWGIISGTIMSFLIRWWYNPVWLNLDLLFCISLFISFRTVPQPVLQPRNNAEKLVDPGKWLLRAQKWNIYWSLGLAIWSWFLYIGTGWDQFTTLNHSHMFSLVPLFFATTGWYMRGVMESVNLLELQNGFYNLKGA